MVAWGEARQRNWLRHHADSGTRAAERGKRGVHATAVYIDTAVDESVKEEMADRMARFQLDLKHVIVEMESVMIRKKSIDRHRSELDRRGSYLWGLLYALHFL